ncbi:MAG: PadR family transcriptional regulator [Coriobacteriia bacterium]|nr:PadR family transcriptional regulator [Coriobacteriia bacterium]
MTGEDLRCCEVEDNERAGRRCCGRGHAGGGGGHGTLVEPAAIAALLTGGSHGYDLQRIILEMTDGQVDADAGGLYRVLRRLEGEGYAVSAWCEEGSGPRRRDYELTSEGLELARHWIQHLRERETVAGLLAGLLESGLVENDGDRSAESAQQ